MADQKDSRAKTLIFWASELGCSVVTLQRAVKSKELLAYRHPTQRGRPWMATATDVSAFLERRRAQ